MASVEKVDLANVVATTGGPEIVFGSCMVDLGDADAMVTGVTRTFSDTLEN